MISYNCFIALCQGENNLIQITKQTIVKIESEISYINTLLRDSDSSKLTPRDLDYYKKELENILFSNIELLNCVNLFLESICKLTFMAE